MTAVIDESPFFAFIERHIATWTGTRRVLRIQ